MAASLQRRESRRLARLQRQGTYGRLGRSRRLHSGFGRRRRRFGLYRNRQEVRQFRTCVGLETHPRRQQRYALPRGRKPQIQGSVRYGPRIPAHRQRGLGRGERPCQVGGMAEVRRGLRHAPARLQQDARKSAGSVEHLEDRIRQRSCGALAQRRKDSGVRGVDRRLVRQESQRQMG